MDSRVFDDLLINHKVFDIVKCGLDINSDVLKNLIELKDDILYIWHSSENCLLTLNLKQLDAESGEIPYQKLHLISAPSFAVERLVASDCGTKICTWGSRGVVVVELPTRWGRGGLFDGGKETILCKSYALDERFLYVQGEVRRVHWHPDSLTHLLVLLSDNTIRLYNVSMKSGPKLVKILNIGQKPSGLLAGKRILDSLGDTAVDFTVAPNSDSLLILRGNGDVYMIQCDLNSKSPFPPKLYGPLTMYPPADDNYGEESCAIAVLGGDDIPPVVVIGTSSAILYHCLLLPEQNDDDDLNESTLEKAHALYVVEAVELNIVLSGDDEQIQHSYPVHLYPCTRNSYACVHAAGVHLVMLPVVEQLKNYALADEDESESALGAVLAGGGAGAGGGGSVARYAVCTHAPRARFRPPRGLAATPPPLPALLVLCADGRLLTRTIEPYNLEEQMYKEMQLKNPALAEDEIAKLLKERQKLSFTMIVQEILTRGVSQPILKLSTKDEPSPKESLEFLTQATLKLRQEYMLRQDRVLEAIRKKVRSLSTLNTQQNDWYTVLKRDTEEATREFSALVGKCALAEKHQDDLQYRCAAAVRALRAGAGGGAGGAGEREARARLGRARARRDALASRLRALRDAAAARDRQINKWQQDYKKKDTALGKSHSDTISSILQQQTSQISTLIEETKTLKAQLNVD